MDLDGVVEIWQVVLRDEAVELSQLADEFLHGCEDVFFLVGSDLGYGTLELLDGVGDVYDQLLGFLLLGQGTYSYSLSTQELDQFVLSF